MTAEQKRKMLEAAAKACGLIVIGYQGDGLLIASDGCRSGYLWEPIENALDTAEMCAKLDINTFYYLSLPKVECSAEDAGDEQVIRYTSGYENNPGEKLKAWMYAATMVAAKIGGYENDV